MANEAVIVDREEQLVVFRLQREHYGVPIASVREIIRWQEVTHLPHTPEFVEGVINLRGTVIPVIDLARRFDMGAAEATSETRIVVVDIASHLVGMVVDSVSEVLRLATDAIEPPSVIGSSVNVEFLRGVGKAGDRLIVMLDLDKVLSTGERKALAGVSGEA